MKPEEFWLCWSPSQQTYSVDSKAYALRSNQNAHANGRRVDYVVLYTFGSEQEARAMMAALFKDRGGRE